MCKHSETWIYAKRTRQREGVRRERIEEENSSVNFGVMSLVTYLGDTFKHWCHCCCDGVLLCGIVLCDGCCRLVCCCNVMLHLLYDAVCPLWWYAAQMCRVCWML